MTVPPSSTANSGHETTQETAPELPDGFAAELLDIAHVGVAVADLNAALAFYRDTLGFRVELEQDNQDQGFREAMLQAPQGGAALRLLAPLSPDSPIGKFLDRAGPGLQQLALTVRDVDAAAELLRGAGLRVLYPAGQPGTAGSMINFVHPQDTGGVLLELVQPADG